MREEVKRFKKGFEAFYNFSEPLMFEIGMLSEQAVGQISRQ